MINWVRTLEVYNFGENDRIPKKQKVVLSCDRCGAEAHATKHYHYRRVLSHSEYLCASCCKSKAKNNVSVAVKRLWSDPEYVRKQKARRHSEQLKSANRDRAIAMWSDARYVEKFAAGFDPDVARANLDKARTAAAVTNAGRLKELWGNADYRRRMSDLSRSLWTRGDYRTKVVDALVAYYSDPEVRHQAGLRAEVIWASEEARKRLGEKIKAKWSEEDYRRSCAEARNRRPTTSNLETIVAMVLTGFEIEFIPHFMVGPWEFDFYLPASNTLIETNGLYWHSLRPDRDRAKRTYVSRHTNYRLMVVDEHDFMAEHKVARLFARSVLLRMVDFKTLGFSQCLKAEVDGLLAAFHYMGKPTRTGRYFKVVCGDDVIAAAIMSAPHRIESATSIGLSHDRTLELSRFAIDPRYQVKNLASWTIARLLKWAKAAGYAAVISYADTGLHTGTIYRASGFECLGPSRARDYEYLDDKGFRLHKKTVWDAAKRNSLSEADYATKCGLRKSPLSQRLKFVKRLG